MAELPERLAAYLRSNFPYTFCYPCLTTNLGESERRVRDAAQIAVLGPGFSIQRRVCSSCRNTDDLLSFTHP
jgi:hypothetical protein